MQVAVEVELDAVEEWVDVFRVVGVVVIVLDEALLVVLDEACVETDEEVVVEPPELEPVIVPWA